ncbi:helix-turn-helix domain-containing protein [Sphingobacterium siyangense]|uniref:helix-turn-helix domain-containing protein n=1 Tax=Sphingobacterium siyangense TaxID=459529 RepID=UPI0019632017|nr:helix-turn-helix domain-containing protein [Sphingobacterium siyangense]QRY56268.1 AraC family transcriptional regulator [Sphingobacterium siyangense]
MVFLLLKVPLKEGMDLMEEYFSNLEAITKDLESEAIILNDVAYFKLAGASKNENFRSPDSYVFIIFKKSKGIHTVDFETYEEKDLQIHISFPGQIHSWDTADCAVGHKLIIKKEYLESMLYDSYLLSSRINRFPVLNINEHFYRKLGSEIFILEQELADFRFGPIIKVRTELILRLIDTLVAKLVEKGKKRLPQLIINFYILLDENFIAQKNIGFYADKLAITAGHLSSQCREYTGLTAKENLDQRILLEAKRLLLGTTYSIKEITFKLDFGTMSRFSIFFKAKTGYNPKEFRNRFM